MHWSRAYRVIVAIGFVYMETYPNVDWCPNRITDCLGGPPNIDPVWRNDQGLF